MLRKNFVQAFVVCSLAAGAAPGFAQESGGGTRIALISVQDTITRTQEGQKLTQELQEKYKPREDGVKNKQAAIAGLRSKLTAGQNTMSDEAKRKLLRDIQTKERELKRYAEDAETDFQAEFRKFQQEAFGKVRQIVRQYMTEKGYSLILDISNPQTPIVDASNELLITNDIIELYDKAHPVAGAAAPAAPATPPAGSGSTP